MSTPPRRATRQQAAVADMLGQHETFRSAQEWHALLRAAGDPVGLATVYRTLQSLAEAGEVDVLRTDAGETLYRACSTAHHHHLLCRECGFTVEVDGPAVDTRFLASSTTSADFSVEPLPLAVAFEAWATAVASAHGFALPRHTVEVTGLCPKCAPGTSPE